MASPVPPEFFAQRDSLIDSINNECATHITNFLGSSDDVAYFIGSGLSQPDYPSWRELVSRMGEYFGQHHGALPGGIPASKSDIDVLSAQDLQGIFQLFRDFRPDVYVDCIRMIFHDHQPTHHHDSTTRILRKRPSLIATLNYDPSIEAAATACDVPVTPRFFPTIGFIAQEEENRPVVMHAHGMYHPALYDDPDLIALHASGYRRFYGDRAIFNLFGEIFFGRDVVFLGTALSEPEMVGFFERLQTHFARSGKQRVRKILALLTLLRHHILNCPPVVVTDKGYRIPLWLAEPYVLTQIKNGQDSALDVLFEIKSNNARFYEVVAEAAIIVSSAKARTLLPLLIEYINNRFSFSKRRLIGVLSRFAAERLIAEGLTFAAEIVRFARDPNAEEKQARKHTDPEDWTTSLEPQPKLDHWEYNEVLEKGVRTLAKAAPLDSALLLISAATEMLQLKSERGEEHWHDTSEIWASRVDQPNRYETDPKAALVRTLTFACVQVYEQAGQDPVQLETLDHALREARWLLFTRVRHHLYSQYPAYAQKWIQDSILEYTNYDTWEYHFEFQRMIRRGIEHFGTELISRDQLTRIFERILSGPPQDRFQEFMGDRYTEESFVQRQRHFQLYQLRPFERVLFGKYKRTYESLCEHEEPPSDEDYSPYPVGESKSGGSRSPKPVDELLAMRDDDLIAFLNEWDNPHRDSNEWWIDIDFQGVGIALKEAIKRDPDRFLAWGSRWHSVTRPIYFSHVLELAKNWLKEKKGTDLAPWLDLSEWIIRQPYILPQVQQRSDDSTESRDWDSARRAVVDLVEACFAEETDVSIEWRTRLFEITKAASLGPDRYLDRDKALVTPRDHLTDAINTTRGRALQNLIQYGFWIRQKRGESVDVSEVFEVLDKRFKAQPALTYPEYALLGTEFNRMLSLHEQSGRNCASSLFPLDNASVWRVSFSHYLAWDRAFKSLFALLRQHFEFALENIANWTEEEERRSDPVAHLGEHLFAHYVWGNDELESNTGLLRRFYEKTSSKQWAALFDHVGRSLKNSPVELELNLKERCKAFFEYRLAAHDAQELQEFMFWLEAPSLEAEWRLNAFLRTLEVTKGRGRHMLSFLESLNKLLPEQLELVVRCFAKLTEAALTEEYFYVQSDKAIPILEAGLQSLDNTTREAAMTAQDNLLKAGHSEFLNVVERV